MSNTKIPLDDQFLAVSGAGGVQTAFDVPMLDAKLDTRDKCTITVENVETRKVYMDCEDRDPDERVKFTHLKRFTFVYVEVYPQIMARWAAYYFGATAAPVGTPVNEIQTLMRTGTVSGGVFPITFPLEGRSGLSKPIAWNATPPQIQAALVNPQASIGNILKSGDVAVSGDWTTGIIVEFLNRLRKADLPLLTINAAGLTGAGAGISVTETTPGEQNYFPFTRSTSKTKVYFSFGLGFKSTSALNEKYYNAVVEKFDPVITAAGDVGLTVTVLCNFDSEVVPGLVTPPCIRYPALKSSECRVEINNNWETLDVLSENYALDDKIPIDSDTFGFDGMNPESFERGKQPTASITASIFGTKLDPLGIAVANEEEVPYITHFGFPGNRFSLIAPRTSVISQTNPRQFGGTRDNLLIALDGLPLRDGINPPISGEAYLDQSVAFLLP